MMTITTQMDAQAQAESHYILLYHWGKLMNSGEVGTLWVDESRCQPKFRPTSTLAALLSNQSNFAPGMFTFLAPAGYPS